MKTDVVIVRAVFVLLFAAAGFFLNPFGKLTYFPDLSDSARLALSVTVTILAAVWIILLELRLRQTTSLETAVGAGVGLIGGLAAAFLAGLLISLQRVEAVPAETQAFLSVIFLFLFGYLGLMLGAEHGEKFGFAAPVQPLETNEAAPQSPQSKVLDTSIIIDGRITEIVETGFIGGTFIVPQFVLRELQNIADSYEQTRRQRGRRGFEMLKRLRSSNKIEIKIVETDFPEIRKVDLKLIELAKQLDAILMTNDYNLHKTAEIEDVEVWSVNELAQAVRQIALPGETMRVFILKEGKEARQGLGYLHDGTMIVVDDAEELIGTAVEVTVTSVLQTAGGKMMFGRLCEFDEGVHDSRPPHPRRRPQSRDARPSNGASSKSDE